MSFGSVSLTWFGLVIQFHLTLVFLGVFRISWIFGKIPTPPLVLLAFDVLDRREGILGYSVCLKKNAGLKSPVEGVFSLLG